MMCKNLQKNKGYTLLFAVLVSALTLSVGISILNISKKEFLLASSARESTTAFYAADSGIECAVYYDNQSNFSVLDDSFKNSVNCAGSSVGNPTYTSGSPRIYTFDININGISCARVFIKKYITGGQISTSIESRGYNVGVNKVTNTCVGTSPKKVERALYYTY